jgi:hypothetical protein
MAEMYDFWISREQQEARRRVNRYIEEIKIDIARKRQRLNNEGHNEANLKRPRVHVIPA